MDDGAPGVTSYSMLLLEKNEAVLKPCFVPYDTRALKPLFAKSGMASAFPIMAHIICKQMEHNHDYLVPFVTLARQISAEKGETSVSEASWHEADARCAWPDGISTADFWRAQM